ncbi:skin secretory protein xP2-like [Sorghum bicolor]|uniref:skin secretory protein xP2-like n=1 Tax=Sorghum bicolor TaxID=4558 RepID=UPI000B42499C|nr:skin secretory protein xP2-like [Sorghum bicolor]|eukprot:XP_021318464.1 skin secretory protein xP2-like [Sorghum bicolor]
MAAPARTATGTATPRCSGAPTSDHHLDTPLLGEDRRRSTSRGHAPAREALCSPKPELPPRHETAAPNPHPGPGPGGTTGQRPRPSSRRRHVAAPSVAVAPAPPAASGPATSPAPAARMVPVRSPHREGRVGGDVRRRPHSGSPLGCRCPRHARTAGPADTQRRRK